MVRGCAHRGDNGSARRLAPRLRLRRERVPRACNACSDTIEAGSSPPTPARRSRLMESKVKLLGHPLHPMLVVFPFALFSVAVLFDGMYLASSSGEFARFAFWSIGIGLAVGLAAALAGL